MDRDRDRRADLATPIGSPVLAPTTGAVSFAGQDDASGDGGLGVKLLASDGASIGVWHLSRVDVARPARRGQHAARPRRPIGRRGLPHTHLQIEVPPGNPVDPIGYLASLGDGGPTNPGDGGLAGPGGDLVPPLPLSGADVATLVRLGVALLFVALLADELLG